MYSATSQFPIRFHRKCCAVVSATIANACVQDRKPEAMGRRELFLVLDRWICSIVLNACSFNACSFKSLLDLSSVRHRFHTERPSCFFCFNPVNEMAIVELRALQSRYIDYVAYSVGSMSSDPLSCMRNASTALWKFNKQGRER